jgi:squalene-hopene/tetraprenyl-beta-curcumene cyclase
VAADHPTSPPPAPRLDRARLQRALEKTRAALLAERGPHGHWEGELSSSALSTATAVTALELWQRHAKERPAVSGQQPAIEAGLKWLAEHQNADGGWGDTTLSFSNISTTALCWAAFGAVPGAEAKWPEVVRRAEEWLAGKCSVFSVQYSDPKPAASVAPTEHFPPPLNRSALITAIIARYGKDRTFSVPILTMCALAGRLGEGKEAWRRVIQLPFELAALPQKFFAALRLPVVSYALPALIAIGQVRHHHLPTRNPLTRWLRDRARAKTLRVLERIQPPGGGFLEATPLTSFVTMSLAGSGQADHPVAQRGVEFLLKSMRPDGSWPIDTNLATWVTTLAVNALGPSIHEVINAEERARILEWLLAQQYRTVHPYTNAPPGGWAWTDLPGGVPDADDTAGALLALKTLSSRRDKEADPAASNAQEIRLLTSAATDGRVREAAIRGVQWLLDLQNRDGGIPTFCRGWTNLPFDRSSPDITAHALRACLVWIWDLPKPIQIQIRRAKTRGLRYLHRERRASMTWDPLWFGNQQATQEANPTYGTTKVVQLLGRLGIFDETEHLNSNSTSYEVLFKMQNPDCGWGGELGCPSSVEETALVVETLAGIAVRPHAKYAAVLSGGISWLIRRVEDGTWTQPAPIGFYFAKLWYYERLYPMVFTVAALEAVARLEKFDEWYQPTNSAHRAGR